jgi:O-antigen/teichoic acid export membrane protein
LFNILPMLIGMIIGPMWPAYTDALARGDGHWIRKTFLRTAMGGAAITLVLSALLVVFGNVVLSFWVGPQIHASHALLFAFGIRCLLSSYLQPISFFLNGVGQLRVQAVIAIIMAIFNLALSIVLVQHFGIIGAILGTIVAEVIIVLIPETIIVRRVLRQLPRQ